MHFAVRNEHASLQTWGLDHEAAYLQLPAKEPGHTFVILETPAGPTLWKHNVLLFGSAASVWSYCRVAEFMTWLTRCLLLSPSLHFVDDFGASETSDLALSGFDSMKITCGCVDLRFKESKEQPPARDQVIQGVLLSLQEKQAEVRPTPDE